MSEYPYKNIPLTPSVARYHILEYLSSHSVAKRDELVKYAEDQHRNLAGKMVGDPTPSVKKALNGLVDDGKVAHPALAYYSLRKEGSGLEPDTDREIGSEQIDQDSRNDLVPSEIMGEGNELVYVYYQISDREIAELRGRNFWPCKIGFTAVNLTARIFGQFSGTPIVRLPEVGLVIRTEDGHSLERAIHFALVQAEVWIEDAIGKEWFETSPDRIKTWYQAHMETVGKLRTRQSEPPLSG